MKKTKISMVSAYEVFLGFSRYYNSLGITFEESIATHTGRIISYMDKLGRMLGYRIFSEISFSHLFRWVNKECPPELMRKKPDMCWGHLTEHGLEYELVLESEQSMDDKKIEEDVEKLLPFPSRLKVLYCAHTDLEEVIASVANVVKKGKELAGELLLIIDPWVSRKTFSTGTLSGILMNSSLEITHCGEAEIEEFRDGSFKMRLFKNAKWSTLSR